MSPARPKIRKKSPDSPKVRVFEEKAPRRISGRKASEDFDIVRDEGPRSGGWKTPEGRSSSSDSEKEIKPKKLKRQQQ